MVFRSMLTSALLAALLLLAPCKIPQAAPPVVAGGQALRRTPGPYL